MLERAELRRQAPETASSRLPDAVSGVSRRDPTLLCTLQRVYVAEKRLSLRESARGCRKHILV
eukprot:1762119-Alexandrium_andersonii.AAC.1